jgi:RNA polymerase sigma-70 factor (ECF subfamily)
VSAARLHQEPASKAIPRLLALHGGRIYGLGLRMCRSPQDAEDLVQETFLRAFRKWEQFEGRSDPATWLYTIASRICHRRQRRRAGEPSRLESLDKLLPSRAQEIVDLASTEPGPLDRVLRHESREIVERAIGKLPPRFRLPLVLKDLVDFSLAEIARVLGVKQATVKTRLHRARLFIARELARALPKRPAPPPDHGRRVCLDLLLAKQEALDRDVPFPLASAELCDRCRSLFSTLDFGRDLCRQLERGHLPERVRRLVEEQTAKPSAGAEPSRPKKKHAASRKR